MAEQADAALAIKRGLPPYGEFGLDERYIGMDLWSSIFGIVLPLGLIGAAIYIRLGGRRAD